MEVYRDGHTQEDALSMLIPGPSNGGVRLGTREYELLGSSPSPEVIDEMEEAKAESVRIEEARREYMRASLVYRVQDVEARVTAAKLSPSYSASPVSALAQSGAVGSASRLTEYIRSGMVTPEDERMARAVLAPCFLELRLAQRG